MKDTAICSLVRDLLPLYSDQLTSEESAQLVEQHLADCEECKEYCLTLQAKGVEQAQLEEHKAKGISRLLRRYRYELIGLISGVIAICLLITLTILFTLRSVSADSNAIKEHFTQTQDYGKQNYMGISELSLFPDSASMTGQIQDFYYDCAGGHLYQDYQIYLKCSYDENTYADEKTRLLAIQNQDTKKAVIYSDDEFSLPGVYAMLYSDGYEYALFSDTDRTIMYIYLQGIDRRELYFSSDYLPRDYGQFGYDFETERSSYCIYQRKEGDLPK